MRACRIGVALLLVALAAGLGLPLAPSPASPPTDRALVEAVDGVSITVRASHRVLLDGARVREGLRRTGVQGPLRSTPGRRRCAAAGGSHASGRRVHRADGVSDAAWPTRARRLPEQRPLVSCSTRMTSASSSPRFRGSGRKRPPGSSLASATPPRSATGAPSPRLWAPCRGFASRANVKAIARASIRSATADSGPNSGCRPSAPCFNAWLRAYYERLITRGKLRKVAIVAAMRKLLLAVCSVAKSRRPFVPHLTPQETPA